MSLIPITTLTPAADPPPDKAIRGIVTLFWPYSSSTRQCALLLADPDFRLRTKQGQVRVRFTGASAEAVAKSRVGIGDEVVLSLGGARWEEDPEATRTPGRSVDGELFFRRRLQLVITKDGQDVRVEVDAPASPPMAVEEDGENAFATPMPKAVSRLRDSVDLGIEGRKGYAYTTPAFAKRLRLTEDSLFDSFAKDMDIDGEEENRRTSFGPGMKWRYAAKTPSPTKETAPTLERAGSESPVRQTRANTGAVAIDATTTQNMGPPSRPRLQLPSDSPPPKLSTTLDADDGPSTPKLLPVKSPTLPLPSPFPTDSFSQSQFGSIAGSLATQTPTKELVQPMPRQNDDEMMSEAPPVEQPSDINRDIQHQILLSATEPSVAQPATPTKVPVTSGFGFGFDGAAASPIQPQKVSPQDEEKKRVMAQTFRSLFGFTSSSQPQSSEQALQAQEEHEHPLSELEQQRLNTSFPTTKQKTVEESNAVVLDEEESTTKPSPAELVTTAGTDDAFVADPFEATSERQTLKPPAMPELQEAAESTNTAQIPEKQPSQPRTQEGPEVIEIDSSSEDEDEDEQPALTIQEVSRRSHEIPDTYQDSQAEDLMTSQTRDTDVTPAQQNQDRFGSFQPQRSDESLFESFIESEHLYPDLPLVEEKAKESGEPEVKALSPEVTATQPAEQEAVSQQATTAEPSPQQPSHPSLPLSPSNSQSIQDMASQAALQIPDLMGGLLPPTPQLTQAGSSASYLQDMLGSQPVVSQDQSSQQIPAEKPAAEIAEAQSMSQAGPNASAVESSQAEAADVETGVQAKDQQPIEQPIEQPPVEVQAPAAGHVEITTEEAVLGDPESVTQPANEPDLPPPQQVETGRITRAKAKKAAAARVSNIPDAISSYFSPKRSSAASPATNGIIEPSAVIEPGANGHTIPETKHLSNGFSTALSYFTPLSRLDSLLNPSSSQQAFGTSSSVDVLAVVTDSTTEPVRAKAGPKDHYTIFRITDSSLTPTTSIRVEVFRPYKNTLPSAKEGDVILLRAFAVKSRKRQPYLISSDASAWCVFSFSPAPVKGKPKWALKAGEEKGGIIETVSGPPVEFGKEERQRAKDLKKWWDDSRVHDDDNEVNGMNGHAAKSPVAAKL